jgi:hypothetical protein
MTTYKLRKLGITDEEVLNGVEALTKKQGETYENYLQKVKSNPNARRVKLADINDNMSVERLSYLPYEKVEKMVRKYWIAMRYLRDIDPEPTVDTCDINGEK